MAELTLDHVEELAKKHPALLWTTAIVATLGGAYYVSKHKASASVAVPVNTPLGGAGGYGGLSSPLSNTAQNCQTVGDNYVCYNAQGQQISSTPLSSNTGGMTSLLANATAKSAETVSDACSAGNHFKHCGWNPFCYAVGAVSYGITCGGRIVQTGVVGALTLASSGSLNKVPGPVGAVGSAINQTSNAINYPQSALPSTAPAATPSTPVVPAIKSGSTQSTITPAPQSNVIIQGNGIQTAAYVTRQTIVSSKWHPAIYNAKVITSTL
jgi:hypothetical protein